MSLIGGRWDETKLIGLAYDFEQTTHIRVHAEFIPPIGTDLAVPQPASNSDKQLHDAPFDGADAS